MGSSKRVCSLSSPSGCEVDTPVENERQATGDKSIQAREQRRRVEESDVLLLSPGNTVLDGTFGGGLSTSQFCRLPGAAHTS